MKTKTKKPSHPKRHGAHHRHSLKYKQVYWPYLPLVMVSLFVLVISFVPRGRSGQTLAYATQLSSETLLKATNQQRQQHGSDTLLLNEKLSKAAEAKAKDMVARNYWSHTTPDGQEPWSFISEEGYRYLKAGENLAYGFSDSNSTIAGWMNSPTHRDNMLDEEFTEVGFGFVNASNFQNKGRETIVVAMYAKPSATDTVAAPITNEDAPVSKAVMKAETLFGAGATWLPFAIGIISGSAVTGLFINHGLRLRRLIRKGEKYFVAHPLLDVSLVLLVVAAVELSKTVGYIH